MQVGVGKNGARSAAASIAVVDENENVLLNTLVKPSERIVNMRYEYTGLKFEVCQLLRFYNI